MIAQGRFDVLIEGLKRSDEVGVMARAVLVFRDNGAALREAQEQRARAREQAAAEKRDALERLARSFESKILSVAAALAASAAQLDGSARSMRGAADNSGRSAQAATVVAEQSTAAAGTVSEAIDELSMAMRNIDSQLANASGVVAEATRRADIAWIMAATLSISLTVEIKPSALATGNGLQLASCRQQGFAFGKKQAGPSQRCNQGHWNMLPAFMFFGLGASCFPATCQSGDAPCSQSLRLRWCRV